MALSVVNGISTKPDAESKKPRHKRTFPSFFAKSPSAKQGLHDEFQSEQREEVSTSNKSSNELTKSTPERHHKPKPDLPHLNITSASHHSRHHTLIIPKTPAVNVRSTKDSIRDLGLSGAVIIEQPMIAGGNTAPRPILFGDGVPTFSTTSLSSSKSLPSMSSSSVIRSASASERPPPLPEPRPRLLSGNVKPVSRPLPAIPRYASASPMATSSSHMRRPATANNAVHGTSMDKEHGSPHTRFPGTVHVNTASMAGRDNGHVPGHTVPHRSAHINDARRGIHDRAQHGLPPLPIIIPSHHHHTWSVPEASPSPIHSHFRPRTTQHVPSLEQSAALVDLHGEKIPKMNDTSRERIRSKRHPEKREREDNFGNAKVSNIAKETKKALPAPPTAENSSPKHSLQVPPISTDILVYPPPPDVVVCMPSPIPDNKEESISRSPFNASPDPGFISDGSTSTSPLPLTPPIRYGETLQNVQVSDGTNTPKNSPLEGKSPSRRLGVTSSKSKPQSTPPSPKTRRPKLGRTGPASAKSNASPAWPWAPPASWSGPTPTQSDSDAPPSRDEKEESKQTGQKLPRLRKQKSVPKVVHKERKPFYTHLNLSTPSMWHPPMPKGCGEEEEEEYGVLVARASKKKAQCAEDVVVTMQNTGGEVYKKDMADVIPQLRQLKTSKRGKH